MTLIKNKCLAKIAVIAFVSCVTSTSVVKAQEGPELTVRMLDRLTVLEEQVRNQSGELEEARHEISQLKNTVEALNADISLRMQDQADAGLTTPAEAPVPLGAATGIGGSPNPKNAYEQARSLLEQGEYAAAERAFANFVAANPQDAQAGAAQYWLGVTYFVRGQHDKATAAFAKGYKQYPKSEKAADNLLKLSKSLAALSRTSDACTTLDQLSSEHPKAHVQEVASERKKLNCS